MSLLGALELAEKGYSRFEILRHYYGDILIKSPRNSSVPTEIQYVIYNTSNGKIIMQEGKSFLNRRIPCGSLFKLITSLYLAERRSDLLHNHIHKCTGVADASGIKCWNRKGHGEVNFSRALYLSCNTFFASLADEIDPGSFSEFINSLNSTCSLDLSIPKIKNKNDLQKILPGLNFNASITVRGIMKMSRLIMSEKIKGKDINQTPFNLPAEEMEVLRNALAKTLTEGTGSTDSASSDDGMVSVSSMWGKTGTVISGTNSHISYGLFTGGTGKVGIIAVLPGGTGHDCAIESARLLKKIIGE